MEKNKEEWKWHVPVEQEFYTKEQKRLDRIELKKDSASYLKGRNGKIFIPESEAKLWEEFYKKVGDNYEYFVTYGRNSPEVEAELAEIRANKKPWDDVQGMRVTYNDQSAFCKQQGDTYYRWDYIKNTLNEPFCKVSEATSSRGMTGFDF